MIPRLQNSSKWTSLPNELCTQIREAFLEAFPDAAKGGEFVIEGRIYSRELLFRVGYLEKGRLKQSNVEVSMDFDSNKQNALELIHFTVDCAASMMAEVLAAEQDLENFPHTWKAAKLEGKTVYLQVSSVNSKLESEADKLLGAAGSDLVQGNDEEEDREAVISMLGLNDADAVAEDDDDGDSSGSSGPLH